jgi:carbon-monoxide dehydrogenase large subunit
VTVRLQLLNSAQRKASLIGTSLKPEEDLRFLIGQGSYIDDICLPNMAYCAFLRSPYAHANLISIDYSDTVRSSKILGVFTSSDIEQIAKPIKIDIPFPGIKPMYYRYLAQSKVLWAGEAVAAVVATDPYSAEDALETIAVEYKEMPFVLCPEEAISSNSVLLYDDWKDNCFAKAKFSNGDVDHAFQKSDVVIEKKIEMHRYCGVPMETRGCIANWNSATRFLNFWSSNQAPHVQKSLLSEALMIPENRIRVITPDVGGGFGVKLNIYPEDVVVAALSMLCRRPVKWVETRSEHFLAAGHSRSQIHNAKMGFSKTGIIKALSDKIIADVGAFTYYPHNVFGTLMVTCSMLPGPYRIQNYQYEVCWVVTNKTPFGAYRGFGQPEATFVTERLIEIACRELHIDPLDFRLRNIIQEHELPCVNPTGTILESGSHAKSLKIAANLIGYHELQERKRKEHFGSAQKLFGIGLSCNIETTVPTIYGASRRWTAHDSATVKVQPDGTVTVATGFVSIGTSIETTLKQIAGNELGIEPEDISVLIGDTDATPYGSGNYGSRSAVVCSAAVIGAISRIKQKMREISAHVLRVRTEEIEMGSGFFFAKSDPSRRLTFGDIARIAYDEAFKLPKGMEAGLEATYFYEPPNVQNLPDKNGKVNVSGASTNATHAALVEVDTETGKINILKYVIVHDCGKIINPLVVEGQIHGGIAQSIGGTLFEEIVYDGNGQLVSSNFIDYLLPTANDVPDMVVTHIETPSPYHPGGFKGAGEAGTIGVPAAISNAVENALWPHFQVEILRTPLDPNRVWKLIKSHRNIESY